MNMFRRKDADTKKKPIDLVDIYEEKRERDPTTTTGNNNKIGKARPNIIKPKSLNLSTIYKGDPEKKGVTSTLVKYGLGQFVRRKGNHEGDQGGNHASGNQK